MSNPRQTVDWFNYREISDLPDTAIFALLRSLLRAGYAVKLSDDHKTLYWGF